MRPDSQQSISRSRAAANVARGAAAGLTLLGIGLVSQASVENQTPTKPEVSFMDPAFAANFLRYNPQNAFADALWKCWTTFSANIHAPKDNPDMDVTGVTLEVYNKTNPSDVKRIVAVEPSPYRDDKQYPRNSVVEGTDSRVANIFGNPTREQACDKKDRTIDCDETTLVIKEVDGRGASTDIKVECPNSGEKGIACPAWISWSVEGAPKYTIKPTPVVETPKCPEGTEEIGQNPLMCERIKEVLVPSEQPGQVPSR